MQFCMPHWNTLREKIEAAGLTVLVSESGEEAAKKQVDRIQTSDVTVDNFDPLMQAHNAIAGNAFSLISQAGGDPMYLMAGSDVPEDAIDKDGYRDRTWPRCPLCYLNIAHEVTCTDKRCKLPKENGYDFFMDLAVKDQVKAWKALKT